MSLGKVLLYTVGAVGVAAVAKAMFTPAVKANQFAPTGWLIVDPHVLASIDPADVPDLPDQASVTGLPIGTTVAVILARPNGPLPTTVDGLKKVPMLFMEMLVIAARGGGTYDFSTQLGFEPNDAAEQVNLKPLAQGQIFTGIPSRYIAKVVARPGGSSTKEALTPPPLPTKATSTSASFVGEGWTGDEGVSGGAVGRWMYAIHRSPDAKDFDVVWFTPDSPNLIFGARRNGVDVPYVPLPIGSGIDTSHASNPTEGPFSAGVGVSDKTTGWKVSFMATMYSPGEGIHVPYVDIVAETVVREAFRGALEVDGPKTLGINRLW